VKTAYKRWTAALLATVLALLTLCAAVVRIVDPFFHYHAPDPAGEVWFDQRAQSAGLLRALEICDPGNGGISPDGYTGQFLHGYHTSPE